MTRRGFGVVWMRPAEAFAHHGQGDENSARLMKAVGIAK